jgi:hypothetical protein
MRRIFMAIVAVLALFVFIGFVSSSGNGTGGGGAPIIPQSQQTVINVLNKYNQLDSTAPNSIEEAKLPAAFRSEFCSVVPIGQVSDWVGTIDDIEMSTDGRGAVLTIVFPSGVLQSGPDDGGGFQVNNDDIDGSDWAAHDTTIILSGTPFYDGVIKLKKGDSVKFSGTLIPFSNSQACIDAVSKFNSFESPAALLIRYTRIEDDG